MPYIQSIYGSLYIKAVGRLCKVCENHIQILIVQSKFGDFAELESFCKMWNRLMAGFQLSILLKAASDILPTAVNLQCWSVQCGSRCSLCDSSCPTTAHV